jgi:hypothetical protein
MSEKDADTVSLADVREMQISVADVIEMQISLADVREL